ERAVRVEILWPLPKARASLLHRRATRANRSRHRAHESKAKWGSSPRGGGDALARLRAMPASRSSEATCRAQVAKATEHGVGERPRGPTPLRFADEPGDDFDLRTSASTKKASD